MRSKKPFSAAKTPCVIFVTFLLVSVVVPAPAQAQTFKVLHTFKGSDGISPDAQLVRDSAGNLYGTTGTGGSSKCEGGCGTAFKMDRNGKLVWQHDFNGADGETPFPGLMRDASGNLYGTTIYGGRPSHYCSDGCGVVFKLDKRGEETVLHRFSGDPDGYYPVGPLAEDKAGNFYGATQLGGESGLGTVFKLSPAGKETILYSFTGGSDGCDPGAGVIVDAAGDVYGTTFIGGSEYCNSGYGVAFEVDTSGKETVLHIFGSSDGANPASGLILDSAGNVYGTTEYGGNLDCRGGQGCGVVFELSPQSGGGWTESVLYSFCSASNCEDGSVPREGPLIRDSAGNLYGTTVWGGDTACGGDGCGVVFELGNSGNESILHNFTGGTDGDFPLVGLTLDREGNLYGGAAYGGDNSCNPPNGCGTVFQVRP